MLGEWVPGGSGERGVLSGKEVGMFSEKNEGSGMVSGTLFFLFSCF